MPVLVILLILSVLIYLWFARRGSTLTRHCRWRQDRRAGPDMWRCAVCGAAVAGTGAPRQCLRPPAPPPA
ncbi:MAG: hypothetical protein RIR62_2466 [Pseudomonadota bacterium]